MLWADALLGEPTAAAPIRLMVRRDPTGIRLITRNGHDWSGRFPLIALAAGALKVRSFLIDGEAVACGKDGMPSFDRLRYRRGDGSVFLYAFDLLELNGEDMRREPLEARKRQLANLLLPALVGLQFNEHIEEAGDVVFLHACKMGLKASSLSARGRPTVAAVRPTGSK